MQYFLYILAGWIALGVFVTVANVGKPKQPTTGTTAALIVALNAVIVVGLVLAGLRYPHG